ncbi:hypothetical protein JGH11_13225 [Dysgonomonas sp. Marseille-P4677]|uniref:hypothetical protein n=1 Tax=Dysgonomonas sp. Marseille-P4677 TaxID=2364790 RepID=UPI00191386D5|nr:hypothetical protein [Dysgonomonas sp. Marseille-P4677]MBK5721835.1 hypothetical protein [Dysgonomonas sp. Marseille-P4677]
MANDTRKLDPVGLSSLPTIEDPSGFWIFGSKSEGDGTLTSGKYLFDKLAEYARNLQLERRIALTMENKEMRMFIGEEMTIYKIDTLNVSSLSIDVESFSKPDNQILNKKVEKGSLVKFSIEYQTTDPTAYLFIYAKAKLEEV